MRRALALAALIAVSAATAASAETWKKYIDVGNGLSWSYDADSIYKDRATSRLVVMQAVSKPDAHIGPSGPGKPDGVGSVVALDCAKHNLITVGSYKPGQPLSPGDWRSDTPKKAEGPDNDALFAAVCPLAANAPAK